MDEIAARLKIPDFWQQKAVRLLQAGKDVVVHAPTGAGKTYIFELLVESGLKRQAIFTVPTRALANDKLTEWRDKGWKVGICTGDLTDKPDAAIVVATLETQKGKFLRGEGPGILVIDEYQMLADARRGINYELAIALAPPGTQLLLLSGSVANPGKLVAWLRQIGRDAELVHHNERPVPQDEINLAALPDRLPPSVRGFWPQMVGRALAVDLGPILLFAPQRREAEALAHRLAAALPIADWLELTPEQRQIAGDDLSKLLRQRVAFHHSGLNYMQRAGLIEPLAKAGQLRVIVATTGLAAGINFSMRSVCVTEREYRHGGRSYHVRPDELLQMFGRAGRRGLDDKGFILVAPGKPRLAEARPANLKRANSIDWPSIIAVMHEAEKSGRPSITAADELATRLFTEQRLRLGLRRLHENTHQSGHGADQLHDPRSKTVPPAAQGGQQSIAQGKSLPVNQGNKPPVAQGSAMAALLAEVPPPDASARRASQEITHDSDSGQTRHGKGTATAAKNTTRPHKTTQAPAKDNALHQSALGGATAALSQFQPANNKPANTPPQRPRTQAAQPLPTDGDFGFQEPAQKIQQMLSSVGEWERLRPRTPNPLGAAMVYLNSVWQPALSVPKTLESIQVGNLCHIRLPNDERRYGRQVALASFPERTSEKNKDKLLVVRWLLRALKEHHAKAAATKRQSTAEAGNGQHTGKPETGKGQHTGQAATGNGRHTAQSATARKQHAQKALGKKQSAKTMAESERSGKDAKNRSRTGSGTAHSEAQPRRFCTLDELENDIVPLLPQLTQGGTPHEIFEHNDTIYARLDYSEAQVMARTDSLRVPLLNPPKREITPPPFPSFAEIAGGHKADTGAPQRTPAQIWHKLGLIDDHCRPTRRGVIFSFFNHGEGLAIAAALEDATYPLEDLLYDVANLRAGHRFEHFDNTSSRLGNLCRLTYQGFTCEGYLDGGVPPGYGHGAAEVLADVQDTPATAHQYVGDELRHGDIERAALEWRSLLNHIAFAPDHPWSRWQDFRDLVRSYVFTHFSVTRLIELPRLTQAQKTRPQSNSTGRHELLF